MKLLIMRHGETNENVEGIVQGWLDTELNEKGQRQAVDAATHFQQTIDAIYSSDLNRARQTALEFRRIYPNLPYFEDERLRERNFGDATGKRRKTDEWEQFWSIKDRSTIKNAEILNDFTARVKSFLSELQNKQYDTVLIVTHAGVLNRVQNLLEPTSARQSYANATILEFTI